MPEEDPQRELFGPKDPPSPLPTPPETEDEWEAYRDILDTEEGAVPVYGLQIIVFMTPDGKQHTRWTVDGAPDPDLLIGTIERVQFFTHVQNLDVTVIDEEGDVDDDEA